MVVPDEITKLKNLKVSLCGDLEPTLCIHRELTLEFLRSSPSTRIDCVLYLPRCLGQLKLLIHITVDHNTFSQSQYSNHTADVIKIAHTAAKMVSLSSSLAEGPIFTAIVKGLMWKEFTSLAKKQALGAKLALSEVHGAPRGENQKTALQTFACTKCDVKFRSDSLRAQHEEVAHEPVFTCLLHVCQLFDCPAAGCTIDLHNCTSSAPDLTELKSRLSHHHKWNDSDTIPSSWQGSYGHHRHGWTRCKCELFLGNWLDDSWDFEASLLFASEERKLSS